MRAWRGKPTSGDIDAPSGPIHVYQQRMKSWAGEMNRPGENQCRHKRLCGVVSDIQTCLLVSASG